MHVQFINLQINIRKSDKKEKHGRVFVCTLYHSPDELFPLHVVRLAHRQLQVGELSGRDH